MTIEESKSKMVLPAFDTPVRICDKIMDKDKCGGFLVKEKYIQCRRTSENGIYKGWVPGAGGDVWWVEHEDGTIGAYTFDEITDR